MPNDTTPKITGSAWSSSPWPYAIVGFFVVLAIFNFVFVKLALQSSLPPISDHPYEDGLKYQEIITAKNAAKAAGISATYKISASDETGMRTVSVNILQQGGTPLREAKVTLRAYRFSAANMDLQAELTEHDGSYQTTLHLPLAGLWLFELSIASNGNVYFLDSREMLS